MPGGVRDCTDLATLAFGSAAAAGVAFAFACSSTSAPPASALPDAGDADGGGPSGRDANGPGEAGAECSFNRDCASALRCECDGACACQPGARGAGRNGVDACDGGDDCASAVCVEGPDGGFLCSDECATASDCAPKLPQCEDIALVGRICVRRP